jgi:predicted MPP superfamily phosphohydrolase
MIANPSTETLRQPFRRHTLARRAAVRVCEVGARAVGAAALYRRHFLARERLLVRRETLAIANLPRGLDGFRVAQLSDIHAGPFLGRGDLAPVVDATLALAPHLIAITGDLITHAWSDVLAIAGDLGRLRAPHGVFAVFGNHDYRGRREGDIASALEPHGITFLRNASRRIEVEGGALAVVGVEDLEESKCIDLEAARAAVRGDDFELVLCHNPHGAPFVARERCVAVLAGHTHGHQIDLPFARRAGPAHPGTRVQLGATTLIVSRGLGAIGLPLRIGAQAEIVLVELRRSGA